MSIVWGVHNDTLTTELLDGCFVGIGRDDLGDLDDLPPGRDTFRAALAPSRPEDKRGTMTTWAGTLDRSQDAMQPGDVAVAPCKRLLTGEDVVALTLQTYAALPQRWRFRIPLAPVLVLDDAPTTEARRMDCLPEDSRV